MTAGSNDPARLDGQVAIVTGTSGGLGRATARALAALGADVYAMSRSADPWPIAERVAGGQIRRVSVQVSNWASVCAAVEAVITERGAVDVLVNNAAVRGLRVPVWELEPERLAESLAVNTMAPFHLMRSVMPAMIERRSGVVLNVSSGASRRAQPRRAMYGCSKAALDYLSVAASREAEPFGVRVRCLHPGPIDTDLFARSRHDPLNTPAEQLRIEELLASGKVQPPAAVAAALAWLATPNGAAWRDPVVAWIDADVRARLRALPGFPAPVGE